jgi:Ser/Thr protein kinase RdoA (MazF antagonist)
MQPAWILDALRQFGLRADAIAPVNPKWPNGPFCVTCGSGKHFLKLLPAGTTPGRARSVDVVAEFLGERGIAVAGSLALPSGDRFARVAADGQARLAVLHEWIEGFSGTSGGPELARQAGGLLARMQRLLADFEPPPGFTARKWEEVYLPAQGGWLDQFAAVPPVDREALGVFRRAADSLRNAPGLRERHNYGLIHADFHPWNLMKTPAGLRVVDLDDVGWGHHLFDLCWPGAIAAKNSPDVEFFGPFLQGYEDPTAPVPTQRLREFLIAAGLSVVEMIHTSGFEPGGETAQGWYAFAVSWLKKHGI